MRNKFVLFLILSIFALATVVSAQDEKSSQKQQIAVGVAKVVGAQKIVLETKGGMLDAVLSSSTTYFRLQPDNLSLKAATESSLAEITATDKVLVTGTYSEDKKTLFALKVYLVKGSDIAEQQEKQRQEWRTRGIAGRVTEVDADTKLITVEMRGITGQATTIKITPKDEIKYLRYSPNSVKYNDALESKFADIKQGDMIQALGDKSEDGTALKAEEILTGSFQTLAGAIKSIDAEKNEVTITDLKTKKDVTIVINNSSLVKKFPEETAQRMARMQAMMQSGGGVQPPRGQGNGRPGGGEGRGQGAGNGGGRGRMDINEMINSFPTITVSELKVGEVIAVSSPKGTDENRVTAIKLLAGVEPFLTLASAGSGRSSGGRGGVSGGLTIPGLDSVDF